MPDQIDRALMGSIGAGIATLLMYWRERRRDVSQDRVASSADNRAWAEMFRADRAAIRAELDAERQRASTREAELLRELAILRERVAELERVIRRAGLSLPGDTPPDGTPSTGGGT